jgi:hypothetical protein
MDVGTINSSTFTLRVTNGAPVAGIVTYNQGTNTAGFNLQSPLSNSTSYTATITTGAKDLAGNPLASDVNFTFTTGSGTDGNSPTVVSVSPPQHAFNVSAGSSVTIRFSEPMDPASLTNSTIVVQSQRTGNGVGGSLVYDPASNSVTLTPSAPFSNIDSYAVSVLPEVRDATGQAMGTLFQSCFTPESGGAAAASVTGFWSTDNACKEVHIHVTINQTGNTLSLRPDCAPGFCQLTALNSLGRTYLGGNTFADVVSLTGTVSGASVTFTFTSEFGQAFTFTGSFAQTGGQSGNVWLTGSISGSTIPTQGLSWEKQGP